MDSKAAIARFEAERQALAVMDHPNVAKLFDGGATPSRRPCFVIKTCVRIIERFYSSRGEPAKLESLTSQASVRHVDMSTSTTD